MTRVTRMIDDPRPVGTIFGGSAAPLFLPRTEAGNVPTVKVVTLMQWITRTLRPARARTWLAAFAAATAAAALSALATIAAPAQTVHDAGNQFAVDLPSAWTVRTPSGNATLVATAPATGQGLPDSLDVVVHVVPPGMSPQSCVSEAEWVAQHFAHIDFTTISEGPATVAGLPAFTHVYTWTTSTGESRWSQQVCLVEQGKAFLLTGTTANEPSVLPGHMRLLKRIMNSLRILGPLEGGAPVMQPPTSR